MSVSKIRYTLFLKKIKKVEKSVDKVLIVCYIINCKSDIVVR